MNGTGLSYRALNEEPGEKHPDLAGRIEECSLVKLLSCRNP